MLSGVGRIGKRRYAFRRWTDRKAPIRFPALSGAGRIGKHRYAFRRFPALDGSESADMLSGAGRIGKAPICFPALDGTSIHWSNHPAPGNYIKLSDYHRVVTVPCCYHYRLKLYIWRPMRCPTPEICYGTRFSIPTTCVIHLFSPVICWNCIRYNRHTFTRGPHDMPVFKLL